LGRLTLTSDRLEPRHISSHEDAEARARPSPAYVSVPPDVWALARGIAAVLGETMPPPIRLITRAVDGLGPERARAVLGQALTVAAQGGLTLPDGRRRTLGVFFFHLVRASDAISRVAQPLSGPQRRGHTGPASRPRDSVRPLGRVALWFDCHATA